MRKAYKNQRDFYKSEADFWKAKAEENQRKIDTLSKPPKEERVNCAWFCPTCRTFTQGTKGRNFDLEGCRCLSCGHLGVMAASNY